jgi:molybdopterin synthase catalytic subunit
VTRLEYQAYSKLAMKTMSEIIQEASKQIDRTNHQVTGRETVSSLIKCAIHHRLGTVPVGEPSIGRNLFSREKEIKSNLPVVIAVSSPHRKESFIACEFILEEVKLRAQIWKREYYEGEDEGTAQWKENT